LAFVLSTFLPDFLDRHYEQFIFVPSHASLSALVLNEYFHGGWLHLVSNMISLLVFAPALEDRLGAKRFLLLYHLCGLAGNIVQGAMSLLWIPGAADFGILGASGAIAGLMGLSLIRLYFAKLRVGYWAFLPLQAYTKVGRVHIPVAIAVVLWLLLQMGIAISQTQGAVAQIAAGAHLGGFLAGIGFALLLGLRSKAAVEQFLHRGKEYLDRAQLFAAQGEFIEYVRRQPEDIEGHLELARTYRFTKRHSQADSHYRKACSLLRKIKRWDRILEIYREAERGHIDFALQTGMQLHVAQLLERSFDVPTAERAYLKYDEIAAPSDQGALALYRAARLALQQNVEWRAQDSFGRLLQKYPFSAEADLARSEFSPSVLSAA